MHPDRPQKYNIQIWLFSENSSLTQYNCSWLYLIYKLCNFNNFVKSMVTDIDGTHHSFDCTHKLFTRVRADYLLTLLAFIESKNINKWSPSYWSNIRITYPLSRHVFHLFCNRMPYHLVSRTLANSLKENNIQYNLSG